jgi:hypothetical protein
MMSWTEIGLVFLSSPRPVVLCPVWQLHEEMSLPAVERRTVTPDLLLATNFKVPESTFIHFPRGETVMPEQG